MCQIVQNKINIKLCNSSQDQEEQGKVLQSSTNAINLNNKIS